MPDFSLTIPDSYNQISSGFVDTIIQTQREKLFSGLMRLHYPTGERLVFTFSEGVPQTLYRSLEEKMEMIPRQSWSSALERPDAAVGLLDLPLEALRFIRVVYESPTVQTEQARLSITELVNHAKKWAADSAPSVLHVQDGTLTKVYLISGFSTPIFEELVFSDPVRFAVTDATFPNSLSNPECQITRYVSDNQYAIWQEYELRFAFGPLMRMLVQRFSELAGRILTERLCEQLTTLTRNAGWNIAITTNGIVHHHYFETLNEAKRTYLEIVQNFNALASPAIGPRMAAGLSREILIKLNPYHRTLLQQHVFDLYDTNTAAPLGGTSA